MTNKLSIMGFAFMVLILTISQASAGSGTISINGTNPSTAQANLIVSGTNNTVSVSAWNVNGIKTMYVNVTNTSDTLIFLISNNTPNQIDELLINGLSINGYQADNNGLVNFTRIQSKSNFTFTLRPALQQGGYNSSWGWFQNLYAVVSTTLWNNVTIYNATQVAGDGSQLFNLNANNLTNLKTVYKESYSGNGTQTNFTTTHPIQTNSSNVWINGLLQTWNVSYREWSNGINFTAPVGNGYTVNVEYTGT